jgi:hypothetical protein
VQKKIPGKNIRRSAISQRKKNRASKQQSANSLQKILAEAKCIKKSCTGMRLKKKNRDAKILYPHPPGFLMVRPLCKVSQNLPCAKLIRN